MQLDKFALAENVPAAQSAHVRFVRSVPAACTYLPATQSDQGVQAVALFVVVKPELQRAQTRLVVALPAVLWNCPGVQSVHGWHAVAELLS